MSNETQPKEYPIKSFQDICNTITVENKERFLTDVHNAFLSYLSMIESVRAMSPEMEGLTNWEIAEFGFTWVDDGKTEWISTTIETSEGLKVTIDNPGKA
jgi:hypothetical protein